MTIIELGLGIAWNYRQTGTAAPRAAKRVSLRGLTGCRPGNADLWAVLPVGPGTAARSAAGSVSPLSFKDGTKDDKNRPISSLSCASLTGVEERSSAMKRHHAVATWDGDGWEIDFPD